MKFKSYVLLEEYPSMKVYIDKEDWIEAVKRLRFDLIKMGEKLLAKHNDEYYGEYVPKVGAFLITNKLVKGFKTPEELKVFE